MAKVETNSGIASKEKEKYKVTNWKSYNSGLVRRGSLTLWISDDVARTWHHEGDRMRGGQRVYSDSCILTLLSLRAVFHLALRQTQGFAQSIMDLLGIGLKVPSYTQICRRQGGLKVPLRISERLKKGGSMYVVVDSSGLKVYGEGEWKVRQHGAGKRRTWRKIHLAVDEKTGEIVAEVLTKNDADDAGEVPGLLE